MICGFQHKPSTTVCRFLCKDVCSRKRFVTLDLEWITEKMLDHNKSPDITTGNPTSRLIEPRNWGHCLDWHWENHLAVWLSTQAAPWCTELEKSQITTNLSKCQKIPKHRPFHKSPLTFLLLTNSFKVWNHSNSFQNNIRPTLIPRLLFKHLWRNGSHSARRSLCRWML